MILERINGPEDIKKISEKELPTLAKEVRSALINRLSAIGGHVASNLCVVELSVALHYVFSSPKDKIIWDVSHQSYAHKILTGRKEAYLDPAHFRDVTGFSNPDESEHDFFSIGHTATAVSLALGMANARDVSNNSENIIAVVGDGALSGGEAYEALNYAGEYGKNLIIIINDNNKSIAENHGGLYKNLKALRESGGKAENNYFKALGLDYKYLDEGNDVIKITELLKSVKDTNHPIVLHLSTVKGKGLPYAEANAEEWHSEGPFRVSDGYPKNGYPVYDTTVFDSIEELLTENSTSIALTAGTPRSIGYVGEVREKREAQGRFLDVGIAEENAAAMSSGIAKYGATSVFSVYAPFLQRAYDQLSHDVCLNNSPAVIIVLMAGAYGMKSRTHLGMCDIPMLTHIPNLIYLDPAYKEEYNQMFKYATSQKEHPVAIRVPMRIKSCGREDTTDYSVTNRAKVMKKGCGAAIFATGNLIPMALETAKAYKEAYKTDITVISPTFLTGLDTELLERLKEDHSLVVTIEDSELEGGYGERIASYYGMDKMKVKNLGITKAFHSEFNAEALLDKCGISVEKLVDFINKNI